MSIAEELLKNDPASEMLGIKLINLDEGLCYLSMVVTSVLTNGYQLCHGGFVYALADTASAFSCATEGETVLSATSQIEYLAAAVLDDKLTAKAEVKFISGNKIFCDAEVVNQNRKVIAVMHSKFVSKMYS